MAIADARPTPRSETTDLERRVLAHERILQALIAYMARTEPRFVDHLHEKFVEPMRSARNEHDHRGTDEYAEEFIRTVMLLGEARAPRPKVDATAEEPRPPSGRERRRDLSVERPPPDRVQVHDKRGVWQVTVDGTFHGDYHRKEHALAAAALLKLSLS